VAALAVAVFLGQAQFSRIAASEAQGAAQDLRNASKPLVALDYARAALQLDGTRAEYWATFGGVLSDAGNPSAAGNAYQEAAERQPWSPLYWRDLAITYVARGDEPHSVQFLERAVAADPFDVASHDLLARLAYNKGDFERAFDEGALAVRILPSNPDLYDAPIRAAVPLGRFTAAEDMLKAGIALRETAHMRVLLASIYSAGGRRADAIAELDRALVLAPNDPEASRLRQQLVNQ
jgi:tetratricopeptide (TPR) repeat protein